MQHTHTSIDQQRVLVTRERHGDTLDFIHTLKKSVTIFLISFSNNRSQRSASGHFEKTTIQSETNIGRFGERLLNSVFFSFSDCHRLRNRTKWRWRFRGISHALSPLDFSKRVCASVQGFRIQFILNCASPMRPRVSLGDVYRIIAILHTHIICNMEVRIRMCNKMHARMQCACFNRYYLI